ncbi:hypothetical protein AR457_33140 [Streptomyces agglomeratus]|uniref:SGNH/GDSL hydrolase family protein n=1 Tax=Streptomyces agglomeratus TaxID=285458 RepID=UPI000852476A|nr:SGNH/GDSL hydrolase family protein [Streptomyces agglomeratus]OEJ37350.1 hypothetical protein BGK70_03530 [Streptomyces agglomeratus]OEJ48268.1 hypothetical protein AR457_33140 [Streptomyces agglomeratus]
MRLKRFWPAVAATAAALASLAVPPPALAAAPAADHYEWVALGDSYTAGIFTGARGERPDGCERTPNAYPDLVNQELTEFPPGQAVQLRDVSCGNAAIPHITRESQTPIGRGSLADPSKPSGGWAPVAPQIERAQAGEQTDVITIGVGGNSLPFGEIFSRCLTLGADNGSGRPCRDYYEDPKRGVETLDERLSRIQDEYITMLADVHEKAPNAKVITVGYPSLLPAEAGACGYTDPTETFTIAPGDIPWLRDMEERLNQTIRNVTNFFGDRYVDTYASSQGHDACQPGEEKWMEGFCGTVAPESNWPAGQCAGLGPEHRQTFFHPNTQGHTAIAQHVERAIRLALLER